MGEVGHHWMLVSEQRCSPLLKSPKPRRVLASSFAAFQDIGPFPHICRPRAVVAGSSAKSTRLAKATGISILFIAKKPLGTTGLAHLAFNHIDAHYRLACVATRTKGLNLKQ